MSNLMIAYLVANAYFTGLMVGDRFGEYSEIKPSLKPVAFLLFLLLGSTIMAISYLIYFFKNIYKRVDGIFQISFFCSFYLANGFNNMKPEQLKMINKITINKRNTNSLKD